MEQKHILSDLSGHLVIFLSVFVCQLDNAVMFRTLTSKTLLDIDRDFEIEKQVRMPYIKLFRII